MKYKAIVEEIKSLKWSSLEERDLQRLMFLSYVSALEFADSLRIACRLYPHDPKLKEMAAGELQTNNLFFEEYVYTGDHADFLGYFIKRHNLKSDILLEKHAKLYREACEGFDEHTRAMTIFSREEELSKIFTCILKAKNWSAPGLPAFKYYLETHITLDCDDGGHYDLTKEFPIDDRVHNFYSARLNMYYAIPKLGLIPSSAGLSA